MNPIAAFASLRNLPRVAWVTAMGTFINRAGTMALPFLVLFLVEERQYAPADAGKFLALFGIVGFFAGPLSGRLVDRYGTKSVMVGSFFGAGSLVMLVPFATGTGRLAVAVAGWALANEIFRPAVLAHVGTSVSPELRKQAFALNRWALNLGMSIGPAVGGLLASHAFSSVFLVDGATSLLAMVVFAFGLPATPPRGDTSASRRNPFAPLRDPRFVPILLGLVPLFIVVFQIQSSLPLYVVQHLHMSMKLYGLLGVVNTVLIVATEIPFNHATAHWPQSRTMGVGALCIALGFGGYGIATTFPGLVLATAIWTVGEMLAMPALSTYVAEIAGDHNRGAYMGLFTLCGSAAFMVGPWLGTTLFEIMPNAQIWAVFAAFGLVAAALFTRVRESSDVASA